MCCEVIASVTARMAVEPSCRLRVPARIAVCRCRRGISRRLGSVSPVPQKKISVIAMNNGTGARHTTTPCSRRSPASSHPSARGIDHQVRRIADVVFAPMNTEPSRSPRGPMPSSSSAPWDHPRRDRRTRGRSARCPGTTRAAPRPRNTSPESSAPLVSVTSSTSGRRRRWAPRFSMAMTGTMVTKIPANSLATSIIGARLGTLECTSLLVSTSDSSVTAKRAPRRQRPPSPA